MLLIFAFSITPKLFLHDLIVHHKDTPVTSGKDAQIGQTGFRCDCENQVVELPFIDGVASFQLIVQGCFRSYQIRSAHQYYSFPRFNFGLRGPPASV